MASSLIENLKLAYLSFKKKSISLHFTCLPQPHHASEMLIEVFAP